MEDNERCLSWYLLFDCWGLTALTFWASESSYWSMNWSYWVIPTRYPMLKAVIWHLGYLRFGYIEILQSLPNNIRKQDYFHQLISRNIGESMSCRTQETSGSLGGVQSFFLCPQVKFWRSQEDTRKGLGVYVTNPNIKVIFLLHLYWSQDWWIGSWSGRSLIHS